MHKYTLVKNNKNLTQNILLTWLSTKKFPIFVQNIEIMAFNRDTIVKIMGFAAGGFLLYILFKGSKAYGQVEYAGSLPVPVVNDDRQTFRSVKNPSDDNYVRGYAMPSSINDLKYDSRNMMMIITKPDVTAFKQPPRAGISVKIDYPSNKLIYVIEHTGEIVIENYDDVKNKIVLMSKENLKV